MKSLSDFSSSSNLAFFPANISAEKGLNFQGSQKIYGFRLESTFAGRRPRHEISANPKRYILDTSCKQIPSCCPEQHHHYGELCNLKGSPRNPAISCTIPESYSKESPIYGNLQVLVSKTLNPQSSHKPNNRLKPHSPQPETPNQNACKKPLHVAAAPQA